VRPLELSMMLINLLTLGLLAVPRLGPGRWTGYVALIAVLITIAQIIVEDPRWQIVPAYALTGLFVLVLAIATHHASGQAGQSGSCRLGHRAWRPSAADLCCPADREPGVSLPASKRAVRDWQIDLPLGRCCTA
jgi:hypothetical protein